MVAGIGRVESCWSLGFVDVVVGAGVRADEWEEKKSRGRLE